MFNLGLGNRDFRVFIYWKQCSGDQPSKEQGASKGGSRQLGCLPPSHLHHPTPVLSHLSMGRSPCCDENGLKKGPWTPEEDQKLMEYIQKHGHGSWRALPKLAGMRRERELPPFSLRKRGRSLPCENVAHRSHLFLQGSTGVARAAG